jgi:putative heme-binding domain-containing protein
MLIRAAGLVALFCVAPSLGAQVPSQAVLEKYLDRTVEVYGHYAAIRLPITRGVTVWNPGAIRVGPEGKVFVANYVGEIFSLRDSDGDGIEDTAELFCNVTEAGLRCPTTIAFVGKELFVGTAQGIWAYEDINGDGKADRSRKVFEAPSTDDPQDWTFGLCAGPDGYLYANFSTDSYNPAPAKDPGRVRGSLRRFSTDGSFSEEFATGLRFAPGMAFDETGALYFSDNEGGGNDSEELNVVRKGGFYGHNPEKFGKGNSTNTAIMPLARLSTARGVCGITFNPRTNDFGGAAGDLFVAFWGMGGMPEDGGIGRITLRKDESGALRARETPFARVPKAFDLAFGPTGDLYVTGHGSTPAPMTPNPTSTGAIYRIVPAPWFSPQRLRPASFPAIRGDLARGERLFAERSCAQCHAVDGTTQLLGPNLAHLGALMDFDAAFKSISQPSESIRSGYEAETFETKDGELVSGRILTSDAEKVTLMVAGNGTVTLKRSDIECHRPGSLSLMPEKLLEGLDRRSILDLFAYLEVREQRQGIRWRHRIAGGFLIAGLIGVSAWLLRKATT